MEKGKKNINTSENQKQTMIEYMKNHVELMSGRFSSTFTQKDAEKKWKELAELLNSIPGSKKDWKSWRKTWQDLRSRTKIKAAKIKKYRDSTGGGPSCLESLTPFEEAVCSLIKPVSVEGHSDVAESQVLMEIEESEDPEIHVLVDEESLKDEEMLQTPHTSAPRRTIPCRSKSKLQSSTIAMKEYQAHLEKKNKIQEEYYEKKIELLREQVSLQRELIETQKKIAAALETLAASVAELV